MSVTLHGPDGTGAGEAGEASPRPAAAPVERPSEQIVRAANAVREVTDAQGRLIRFKKLGALETMDLQEIAGATNVTNPGWMTFATIAFSVVQINDERVMRPASKAQLRALVARLGDEGIDAVFQAVMPKDEDVAASQEADGRERAKNS